MARTFPSVLLAALLSAAGPAGADGAWDAPAPDAAFKDYVGAAPAGSMEELRGKAVFLVFFGANSAPCVGQIGKARDVNERLGPKGVVVIGVCPDGRAEIAAFVARNSVTYACCNDPDAKIALAFGVGSVPASVLVNPAGKIVWMGLPVELPEATLTAALAPAIHRFAYEFPPAWKAIGERVQKHEFGAALQALDKLPPETDAAFAEKVRADIQGWAADFKALVDAEVAAGDVPFAIDALTRVAARFKGTPTADELTAPIAAWKADPKLAPELKAGKLLAQARDCEVKLNYRAAAALYEQVMKTCKATRGAVRAKAARERIAEGGLIFLDPACEACRAARAPCGKHR